MSRLTDLLEPGQRVFAAGVSAESALWAEHLQADPDRAREVEFVAVQFPGIDTIDYLAVHPQSRLSAFFMSPSVRRGMQAGRAQLLSLDYQGIVRHLQDMPAVDIAVAQLSLPDAQGWCSAGLASDFTPLAWSRAHRRVAHLNPRMPRTRGSFAVHVSTLDLAIEADAPLLEHPERAGGAIEASIGVSVAGLVRDGDTLQFGVGAIPSAVAASLAGHRRLKLHGGMVTPAMQRLWQGGAIDRDARLTTGVALGPRDFHEFVGAHPTLWFTDASQSHDVRAIAAIPRFIAINGAVEIDLFGQVNSERAGGRLQAGAGGLPAFAQGALLSPGGRSVICLASTARDGRVSCVVPALDAQGSCTLPRYMADVFVTEHGVAEVRGLGLDERAARIMAIAAPEHRDALARAWDLVRGRL